MTAIEEKIKTTRAEIRSRYSYHRQSGMCERHTGRACGGCHFWQGAYATLGEIVGLYGEMIVLDSDRDRQTKLIVPSAAETTDGASRDFAPARVPDPAVERLVAAADALVEEIEACDYRVVPGVQVMLLKAAIAEVKK